MPKGIPIKKGGLRIVAMNIAAQEEGFSGKRLVEDNAFAEVSGDSEVLDITNFPKEMQGCIDLEDDLERYFLFLGKLDRDELLAIVKYEVYNRVLMQQGLSLEDTDE